MKSNHLPILALIRYLSIENDNVLYIDCDESEVKYIDNLRLCKTLYTPKKNLLDALKQQKSYHSLSLSRSLFLILFNAKNL